MKMQGKTDAALEWAKQWPDIDGYLKLNAILTKQDEAAFNTVYKNVKLSAQPFIDGTARYAYVFGLRMMTEWSDGQDEINAEAEELIESWRDWVDEQYPDNVPDWPDASIENIEALYNVPAMVVYQEDSIAEYNFQAQITYIE